ncbi:MAG TPA: 5'-methylthioadenosine/S-adenosylhomocysteine nucleosidase [Phenylobacterium sp.]
MHGILCATPEEVAAVRTRLSLDGAPARQGPTTVWTGVHAGAAVAVAQCGIGKVNAAAAATLLLAVYGAKSLIFSGVAGGLNPMLEVGTVLLADRLAVHDYGMVAAGTFTRTAYGVIPIGAPPLVEAVAVDEDVRAVLAQVAADVAPRLAHPVRLGSVVTGDFFLNCRDTREALRAALSADAVDMESGAVAEVARAWGVPAYIIRTLSDLAGEDSHIAYPQMAAMAAENSAACVEALLARV